MMRTLAICAVVPVLATSVHAQTAVDRAIAAGTAVGGPEGLMDENGIGDIVVPYTTSTPPESGMSHLQFQDRIPEVREQNSSQGRALRATEDGHAVRPEVDIDAQGALFDDANWAHQNAEQVAGQYFTSQTGACETVALPVTDIVDEFCSAAPAEVPETCDLIRSIWVDRYDTYRCDNRASQFIEVCNRETNYVCHQNTDQFGCLANNVTFTGGSVTWNGDEATVSFASPPPVVAPFPRYASVHIARHPFSVRISDHLDPSSIRLTHVQAGGVAQLTKGVIGSNSFDVLETFYQGFGAGIGAGGYCPNHVNEGLIVPAVFYSTCNNAPTRWYVGSFRDLIEQGSDQTVRLFETWNLQRVRVSGDGDELRCHRNPSVGDLPCAQFQPMGTSAGLSRELIRWLNVPAPTHPVPEAPKVWMDTDFTLRVVAPPGQQYAALTFKFEGTCCDDFVDVGVDQCE